MKKVNKKVEQTILQTPSKITLGGVDYLVPHPTLATMVMVSSYIEEFPNVSIDKDDIVRSIIANASKCDRLGDIVAIFLIGAKSLKNDKVYKGRFPFRKLKTEEERIRELGDRIMLDCTPKELNEGLATLMMMLDINDFFAVTTFLQDINVTRRTKVEEMTPSGQ